MPCLHLIYNHRNTGGDSLCLDYKASNYKYANRKAADVERNKCNRNNNLIQMDNALKPTYSHFEVMSMTEDLRHDMTAIKIIYNLIQDEKFRYSPVEYYGMLQYMSITLPTA